MFIAMLIYIWSHIYIYFQSGWASLNPSVVSLSKTHNPVCSTDQRSDCGCSGQLPGMNVSNCVNRIRAFLKKDMTSQRSSPE